MHILQKHGFNPHQQSEKFVCIRFHNIPQDSDTSWKSWNVLDFCNDKLQAWKVLENEREFWKNKTAGGNPTVGRKFNHSHMIFIPQAFFLRNLETQ